MPTIEFLGFSSDQQRAALARVRQLVAELPFADAVVLALEAGPPRQLLTVSGAGASPFLRIATGQPERAAALEACLACHFDLEIVSIRFCPRTIARNGEADHDARPAS